MTDKTPEIRYPEYTEEWQKYKIKDITNNFDKQRVPITANLRISGSTPYYGANSIQDHVEGFTHDGEFVLVAEDGASDLINYPVQYVKGKIWVNNHAHVLQGKSEICNTNFLSFCINQAEIRPYLVGGGRSKLNAEVMMGINLNIPSLPEQQQVGQFFKKIDQQITIQQEKIQHQKQTKQALLQQMFPTGDSTIPKIRYPGYDDEWSEYKLGETLKELKRGLSRKLSYQDIGLPVVRTNNIKNNIFNIDSDVKYWYVNDPQGAKTKNYLIKENDILINFINGSSSQIGTSAVVLSKPNRDMIYSTSILKASLKDDFDTYFWFLLTQTYNYHKGILKIMKSAVQNSFTPVDFKKLRYNFPSLPEQQQVGQFFKKIDQQIQLNQNKLEDMKQMKKGLMQRMFV